MLKQRSTSVALFKRRRVIDGTMTGMFIQRWDKNKPHSVHRKCNDNDIRKIYKMKPLQNCDVPLINA